MLDAAQAAVFEEVRGNRCVPFAGVSELGARHATPRLCFLGGHFTVQEFGKKQTI